MNMLRIFDEKIVRQIYRRVKQGERSRVRTKKQIKNIIARGKYFKIYKIPPTKIVWSC
jgi:hypothetical protein